MQRHILFALAAITALLVIPTGAQAAKWVDGPAFTAAQNSPSNAQLAGGQDGSVTQVWINDSMLVDPIEQVILKVQAQRVAPDGTVGPVLDLDQMAEIMPPDPGDPRHDDVKGQVTVATGDDGTTAIAWILAHGDGNSRIGVAFLSPDGSFAGKREIATLTEPTGVSVAVGPSGVATVGYKDIDPDGKVMAARVTPSASQTTVVGEAAGDARITVASGAGGVTWVAWGDSDGSKVARLAPGGGVDIAPQAIGVDAGGVTLEVSPDGRRAAVAGFEQATASAIGVRLNSSGSLLGTRFSTGELYQPDPEDETVPYLPALAIGNDGEVSVAATVMSSMEGSAVEVARFAPNMTSGSSRQIIGSVTSIVFLPSLAVRADGTVLLSWANYRAGGGAMVTVLTQLISPDGSVGETLDAGTAGLIMDRPEWEPLAFGSALVPLLPTNGDALVGLPQGSQLGPGMYGSYTLRRLDLAPPVIDPSFPSTGFVRAAIDFSAKVTDSGPVTLSWDFGDGSHENGASVSHAYLKAGGFKVKLTATDQAGNESVVERVLRITKRPAHLKVKKAARRGNKVTISGTIAKSAGGAVAVTYRQKAGRVNVTKRKLVRIKNGRWRAQIGLTKQLAKQSGKAKVEVRYPGDEDTEKGRQIRRVKN